MTRSPFNGHTPAEATDIMRANGRQAMREMLDAPDVQDRIRLIACRASKCVLDQLFAPIMTPPGKGAPSHSK